MPEAQDKQPKPEAKPKPEKVVETPQYKEFETLNGAVRRDMK